MVGVVEMRVLREQVSCYAAAFDPALVDGYDADKILHDAAAAENMLAAIKAAAAKRVAETHVYRREGHRSGEEHLARAAGTSVSQARRQIETAKKVDRLEKVKEAVQKGELSPQEAAEVADAASADPSAEQRLLGVAKSQSLGELKNECARVKAAAATDQGELRRKARENRSCRSSATPDQVGRVFYESSTDEMTEIWAAIKGRADKEFERARAEGRRESWDAYAADALLAIVREWSSGCVDAPTKSSTTTKVIVRIDWEALIRGWVESEETCDLAGVGPVPVAWVRDLLAKNDPFVTAVLTKGVDVCTVAHLGRKPTAFQKTALQWLMPTCTVKGCNSTDNLEYDHREDWANTHRTPTDGLDPCCGHHHYLKTHKGWAFVEGTGKREFVPPDHPDHPKNKHGPPATAA